MTGKAFTVLYLHDRTLFNCDAWILCQLMYLRNSHSLFRLAEAELQLDTAQQSVSQLSDRLEEERARREAAEEALGLADARIKK